MWNNHNADVQHRSAFAVVPLALAAAGIWLLGQGLENFARTAAINDAVMNHGVMAHGETLPSLLEQVNLGELREPKSYLIVIPSSSEACATIASQVRGQGGFRGTLVISLERRPLGGQDCDLGARAYHVKLDTTLEVSLWRRLEAIADSGFVVMDSGGRVFYSSRRFRDLSTLADILALDSWQSF